MIAAAYIIIAALAAYYFAEWWVDKRRDDRETRRDDLARSIEDLEFECGISDTFDAEVLAATDTPPTEATRAVISARLGDAS